MKYYEERPKITSQNVTRKTEKQVRQSVFETDQCFTCLKAGFIYIIITFLRPQEHTARYTVGPEMLI